MPDEPNKQMDETLRAYAQARRKAPEVSLHPATRNMLQGEVKRVFGSQTALPWWRKLRAFWPQLAFAGGLCVVFGIAVLSLRQPSPTVEEGRTESGAAKQTVGKDVNVPPPDLSKELKKQEKPAVEQAGAVLSDSVEPAREAPPTDVAPSSDLKRKTAAEPKLNERVRVQNAQPTSVRTSVGRQPQEKRAAEVETLLRAERTTSKAAAAPTAKESDVAVQSGAKAPAPVISPKSTASPDASASPSVRDNLNADSAQVRTRGVAVTEARGRADELVNLSAARRLNFVQVTNTPPVAGVPVATVPSTVLTSFQMEQSGTNLRVLDRDGSIYLGALALTNGAALLGLKVDKAQTENSLAYFFKVQGTNRTLNSDVVLTGNYFEQTSAVPVSLESYAVTAEAATGQKNERQQQSQMRHYIIGNATVGNTSQVPVRAVSTSP